jgi:hypothetical protein
VDQVEDGWVDAMSYVGPSYPYFSVFHILCLRGNLVFILLLSSINMTPDRSGSVFSFVLLRLESEPRFKFSYSNNQLKERGR